ncbi:MAG: hypothetical protein NTV57_12005 [Cyanobacteria bacterium]|nr:hypothetical protein [Cyanobacteriota bacterium]
MEANPLPSAPITATASPSGAVTGWLPTPVALRGLRLVAQPCQH